MSAARRLIINADDFGRSASINEAVIQAHQAGVLTTASLMVNEPAFDEAVAMARKNPRLGVGLHLTLLCGHSCLRKQEIPGLVNESQEFSNTPAGVGFRYFFQSQLKAQLRDEIRAQLGRFRETGLLLDHVNGHLHLHLHPIVFGMLMKEVENFKIQRVRLTRDPFRLNLWLASGHLGYRAMHALIFKFLSTRAKPHLDARGIRYTKFVFGLLQNARVDEQYVLKLLGRLPAGDSELYSHPSLDEFKNELAALLSPQVRDKIRAEGIQLIRYQDL